MESLVKQFCWIISIDGRSYNLFCTASSTSRAWVCCPFQRALKGLPQFFLNQLHIADHSYYAVRMGCEQYFARHCEPHSCTCCTRCQTTVRHCSCPTFHMQGFWGTCFLMLSPQYHTIAFPLDTDACGRDNIVPEYCAGCRRIIHSCEIWGFTRHLLYSFPSGLLFFFTKPYAWGKAVDEKSLTMHVFQLL